MMAAMTDAAPATEPAASKRPSAFISHHSSQVDIARRLKRALAERGIDGWLAPDDIAAGTAFDQAILDQIARSDAIVLLFCAQSDQSRHVKRELMLGEDSAKTILPVRLEEVPAQGLAYWLKDYQWIDWFAGEADAVDRIAAAVHGSAGAAGDSPVPVPDRPKTKKRAGRKPLWIGGGALLLAGAAALLWWTVGGGKAAAEAPIQAGTWTSKREVTQILFPEMAPEYQKQFKEVLETDPEPEDCIAPEVAAKPDIKLFDPDGKGKCSIGSFAMKNGRISGYLTCPVVGDPSGSVQSTMRGTYTPTSMEYDNVVTMTSSQGVVRFRSHETQRWIRPTCD